MIWGKVGCALTSVWIVRHVLLSDVPFLLICNPRLLSRTDNIGLGGNPVVRGYDAARSRLRPS